MNKTIRVFLFSRCVWWICGWCGMKVRLFVRRKRQRKKWTTTTRRKIFIVIQILSSMLIVWVDLYLGRFYFFNVILNVKITELIYVIYIISISWLLALFAYGKHHILETKDLYNVLLDDLSENLGDKLERLDIKAKMLLFSKCTKFHFRVCSCWITEVISSANKQHEKPKLSKAISKALGWSCMKYGIHVFILNVVVRYNVIILILLFFFKLYELTKIFFSKL